MDISGYLSQRIAVAAEPPEELDLPDGVIDASFGEPDPLLFPIELIRDAFAAALAESPSALQYSPLRGHPGLVEAVAATVRPVAHPAEVVITCGSIPAMLLLTHVLVDL